jgi:hypothetical protein
LIIVDYSLGFGDLERDTERPISLPFETDQTATVETRHPLAALVAKKIVVLAPTAAMRWEGNCFLVTSVPGKKTQQAQIL